MALVAVAASVFVSGTPESLIVVLAALAFAGWMMLRDE